MQVLRTAKSMIGREHLFALTGRSVQPQHKSFSHIIHSPDLNEQTILSNKPKVGKKRFKMVVMQLVLQLC